jgi:hypothetical protein
MKRKFIYLPFIIILGIFLFSCSKQNESLTDSSLKGSLNNGIQQLDKAISSISSTKGYELLSIQSPIATKSASDYSVNISLDSIKGVYDYKPVTQTRFGVFSILKFFTKTASSSNMIVNMPYAKVSKPGSLARYQASDSTLANDFKITVSEFKDNYSDLITFDYHILADIKVKDASAGKIYIDYTSSKTAFNYTSEFTFDDGYTAKCQSASGDTIIASTAITNGTKTLYEEKVLIDNSVTNNRFRERTYFLTIGDVEITRKHGWDSAQVYVAGVLQTNAKISIIDVDQDSQGPSIRRKRDIQITFDDGSTTTLSALAGKTISNISDLFASMRQIYFAVDVVDWIAWDIYSHKK